MSGSRRSARPGGGGGGGGVEGPGAVVAARCSVLPAAAPSAGVRPGPRAPGAGGPQAGWGRGSVPPSPPAAARALRRAPQKVPRLGPGARRPGGRERQRPRTSLVILKEPISWNRSL